MNNQNKEKTLLQMSAEELMERCLQAIFDDIVRSEVKGRVEMRDAARRAKTLAETTLTEIRLRRAGVSMFKTETEECDRDV